MTTITKRSALIASAVTVSTVGFTPNFTQNYRPQVVNIKHINTINSFNSKVAEARVTFDNSHEDVANFVEEILGKKVPVTINKYENDSDYLYINYSNKNISIDDNFKEVETLNDESFKAGLNYLFVVEA